MTYPLYTFYRAYCVAILCSIHCGDYYHVNSTQQSSFTGVAIFDQVEYFDLGIRPDRTNSTHDAGGCVYQPIEMALVFKSIAIPG
jgi:hypothetical protein